MNHIDLSDANIEKLRRKFSRLQKFPEFSVCNDNDVRILLFKRRDKFSEIRTALKSGFTSSEEFLVYSFLFEDIPAPIKDNLLLEGLQAIECSFDDIDNIYKSIKINSDYYPDLSDVRHGHIISNDSDLNWALLEDEENFHSVFWCESVSGLFRRCA